MPYLIVPIGPSCAGKSTLYTSLAEVNPKLVHYSWDLLRLQFYSPDYAVAWKMYQADATFFHKAADHFHKLVIQRQDIYVDNMNLTYKSRFQFLNEVKYYNYYRIAYYFDIPFDVLFQRHTQLRARNKVPLSSYEVMRQQNEIRFPKGGEFDAVIKFEWNIKDAKYDVVHVPAS